MHWLKTRRKSFLGIQSKRLQDDNRYPTVGYSQDYLNSILLLKTFTDNVYIYTSFINELSSIINILLYWEKRLKTIFLIVGTLSLGYAQVLHRPHTLSCRASRGADCQMWFWRLQSCAKWIKSTSTIRTSFRAYLYVDRITKCFWWAKTCFQTSRAIREFHPAISQKPWPPQRLAKPLKNAHLFESTSGYRVCLSISE